ncbi:MAG: LAGLIDADG family homing endonuclease, partial [Patescibacteria group bacterium]
MLILASSGAGKSVGYSTDILYQDQDFKTKREEIGKVVDKIVEENKTVKLAKETEGVINPRIKIYSFDNNLNGSWKNVEIAARKVSPKTLIRVATASGREVEITKDHCLVALKNGQVVATKGSDIKIGNYLPIPREIVQAEPATLGSINTYNLTKDSGIKHIKRFRGRVGNKVIKRNSIPEIMYLTREFFELLGFLTAEGMMDYNRVVISSTTKEVLQSSAKYYDSQKMKYNFIKKDGKIIGVNIFSEVFLEVLKQIGASGKAGLKTVSPLVFETNNVNASAFLRAYFEGDGGVEAHEITATTKSKGLASDLSYLLLRFGIITRIKERQKAAINTKNKIKRKYYRISISGQENVSKFIDKIGFITKRKNDLAKKLLRSGNTNVDIVPELEQLFKEIYKELYTSNEIPAPKKFSSIKLGVFKPSRENLLSIVEKIEKRVRELELLETDGLSTLKSLPELEEIIERGKDKKLNTLLWRQLDKSWQTMKTKTNPPLLANTLRAISITHGYDYSADYVGGAIYRSFRNTGESLQVFDSSLWAEVLYGGGNSRYDRIIKARDYIATKYSEKKEKLKEIKQKISWLKTLATSDLFWDPIIKIEKIRSTHKYVYDLQVENQVFLAGHAGLFVHNSFFVKTEALRSLMLGTEIIIIDPETEYKP